MRNLLITFFLLFIPATAFAWCEKYPDISIAEELKKSKFVAIGTVTSRFIVVDPIEDPEGYEAEIYKLKIDQMLVGPRKVEISLYSTNTTARFPMDVGQKYFVFVRTGDYGYWVSSCGNSDEYDKSKKVISEVNKLIKKTYNRVAGGFSPPAPTPPSMRVRTRRFPKSNGP